MGGVRPRPLSRAWVRDAHPSKRTIVFILKQEYIIFSKTDGFSLNCIKLINYVTCMINNLKFCFKKKFA
jgi:hypothetical protein